MIDLIYIAKASNEDEKLSFTDHIYIFLNE